MARISTYKIDNNVTHKDKWIGTDSAGNITKNFNAEGIGEYLNKYGVVAVSGQMMFKFLDEAPRTDGSITFESFGGNGTAFSAITSLKFSKNDTDSRLILDFLQYIVTSNVLIAQTDNLNNFGHFKLVSLTQDPVNTNFYDAELEYIGGNGSILDEKYYSLATFEKGIVGDKNYTHNQSIASATWTVEHNLGKFPSVHIVLSTGDYGFGQINYVDANNLTIELGYAIAGKAYLN